MKKKTGIVVLILIAALTVLLGYTTIVGWGALKTGSMANIKTGLDLSGGVSITYEAVDENPSQEDMDDTVNKLQLRVEQYSTEASVYQQGSNRISIEIPGVTDADTILEDLGKPGSLQFMDTDGNVLLEGSDVADAQGVTYTDSTTGGREYVVQLTFTDEGKEKFAEATTNNVGKQIYIVYDNSIVSAPSVKEAITGGTAQIDGMSDLEEARSLASYIRIGSLSLELNEVYSNVVGATLGQEALSSSLLAGLIGTLIVILFMICVYRISGLASGWALIIFTFLDLLAINAFDVTLTLPGIAGVVLTIGMAVDANVIIYARMREELQSGRSLFSSIKVGFQKAFSAILDGNVTTLIAAAILYFLGTGTIKGFAITLAIGIVLSMFSALVMSRLISYSFYAIGIRSEKAYGTIKVRKPFNFVKRRVLFFVIAIIFAVSAPIGLAYFGSTTGSPLNYSLDFAGGTATTVDLGSEYTLEELESDVKPLVAEVTGDENVQFQQVSGSNQVIIKTRTLELEERTQLSDLLEENIDTVDTATIESENISSTFSGEMRASAVRAAIISIICMLIYIWIRFRDVRFASSAVIALVHDLLVVLAFYTMFRMSVGSTFIAVMLTILGYSVNSTIVIFDRIRENLVVMNGQPLRDIVNASITQTLTRCIYSTLTTFITIFVLFLMGVPSIREFSLPIIIGLIAGMYSSIFVTGSLWYVFKTKIGKNRYVEAAPAIEAAVEAGEAAGESTEAAGTVKTAAVKAAKKKVVDKTTYSSQPRGKKKRR